MTNVRELPKNIEAEQVVIGSAILEPDSTMPILVDMLQPDLFYERRHRVIFRAIRELFEQDTPADIVLLASHLEDTGFMEKAGGRMYLTELLDRTTTTASLEYYADIVKKKALLRGMIEAGGIITEIGFDEATEPDILLDKAESLVFNLNQGNITGAVFVSEFLHECLDSLEALQKHSGTVTGLPSGIPELDKMTTGFQDSELTLIAGRPGMGKTTFLLELMRHNAIREGKTVLVFSLEMTKKTLLARMVAAEARVNFFQMRAGLLTVEQWREVASASAKLVKARIIIDDQPGLSVLEIRARARRLVSQHDVDAVFVDYLQLIEPGIRHGNRQEDVSYISRSLKRLAREISKSLIVASQLNRGTEEGSGRRPRLSDLRESGALEQDADLVGFLYSENYYSDEDKSNLVWPSELIIAKQRNGPVGTVNVSFHRGFQCFFPSEKGIM